MLTFVFLVVAGQPAANELLKLAAGKKIILPKVNLEIPWSENSVGGTKLTWKKKLICVLSKKLLSKFKIKNNDYNLQFNYNSP